jgi:hypothetical protein
MTVLWLNKADTIDPTGQHTARAVETASFVLYSLTGQKYNGIQTTTEAYNLPFNSAISDMTAAVERGAIVHIPKYTDGMRNLRLRHTPVRKIMEISRGGVIVDPDTYSLRNNAYLVQNNGAPWMINTSDLVITYKHGIRVPVAGKSAAIRFANELIHAYLDDGLCSLPERLQSVSRQGMTFAVLDPQDFIQNGRIGIPEVDYFIHAANPSKSKMKARVFSVDQPRGERIT